MTRSIRSRTGRKAGKARHEKNFFNGDCRYLRTIGQRNAVGAFSRSYEESETGRDSKNRNYHERQY